MKTKSIFYLLFLTLSVVVSGCLSTTVSEQEQKTKENDLQIQDYLKVKGVTASKTPAGVYYWFNKSNPGGSIPTVGDVLIFHYTISNLSGQALDSTRRALNQPIVMGYSLEDNVFLQGLALMKSGENLSMLLTSNLAFGSTSFTNLPAYSAVKIDLEIVSSRSEDQVIEDYIKANKLVVAEKTSTGLRIIKTALNPSGKLPQNAQSVTANYTGRLLYKTKMTKSSVSVYDDLFDSNSAGTFSFQLGFKSVVDGWDEAFLKFRQGEKGTIIFPSSLGYKNKTNGNIPAGSPLRFDIEVVNIQ